MGTALNSSSSRCFDNDDLEIGDGGQQLFRRRPAGALTHNERADVARSTAAAIPLC